jgi:hypothetical protein
MEPVFDLQKKLFFVKLIKKTRTRGIGGMEIEGSHTYSRTFFLRPAF